MIHGTAITLYEKTAAGVNEIGEETFTETPVTVENVLIGEPSAQERLDEVNLTGRMIEYVLGIPKGDTHVWTDRRVELPADFPAGKYRTFGYPAIGQEELVPLQWGKNVMVERYE